MFLHLSVHFCPHGGGLAYTLQADPPDRRLLQRTVRILLEYILVSPLSQYFVSEIISIITATAQWYYTETDKQESLH